MTCVGLLVPLPGGRNPAVIIGLYLSTHCAPHLWRCTPDSRPPGLPLTGCALAHARRRSRRPAARRNGSPRETTGVVVDKRQIKDIEENGTELPRELTLPWRL